MKNALLALFLLISIMSFSQSNEISISSTPIASKAYDYNISLNYYKNVTRIHDLGIKLNYLGIQNENPNPLWKRHALSLDFMNRIVLEENANFRFHTNFALSLLRKINRVNSANDVNEQTSLLPCTRCPIIETIILESGVENHLGGGGGFGIDLITKLGLLIGLSYDFRFYIMNDVEKKNSDRALNIFNFNIAYQF